MDLGLAGKTAIVTGGSAGIGRACAAALYEEGVSILLVARDADTVAQAWFQGLNPKLEDRSPARLLREGELAEVGPQVLAAARAFAAVG